MIKIIRLFDNDHLAMDNIGNQTEGIYFSSFCKGLAALSYSTEMTTL